MPCSSALKTQGPPSQPPRWLAPGTPLQKSFSTLSHCSGHRKRSSSKQTKSGGSKTPCNPSTALNTTRRWPRSDDLICKPGTAPWHGGISSTGQTLNNDMSRPEPGPETNGRQGQVGRIRVLVKVDWSEISEAMESSKHSSGKGSVSEDDGKPWPAPLTRSGSLGCGDFLHRALLASAAASLQRPRHSLLLLTAIASQPAERLNTDARARSVTEASTGKG